MKQYTITSADDIREFLFDLYMRTGNAFMPEDDLRDLCSPEGTAVLSKEEAAYLDEVLLDCFVFCNDHQLDLDAIAETVRQPFGFSLQQPARPLRPDVYPAFR